MRQSLDSREREEIEEFVKKLLFRVPYVLRVRYVRPGHIRYPEARSQPLHYAYSYS